MKKKIFGLLITIFTFGMVLNVNAITISTDNSNHATSDSNSLLVTNTGTITISKNPSGRYFASVIVEINEPLKEKSAPIKETTIGIDFGIVTIYNKIILKT